MKINDRLVNTKTVDKYIRVSTHQYTIILTISQLRYIKTKNLTALSTPF